MTPKPATPRQQRYLRALALRTGQTFTPPTSSADASRQIQRLRNVRPSTRDELAYERSFIAEENAARAANCDVPLTDADVRGFGSTATWNRDR